jgi:hypothetical protein
VAAKASFTFGIFTAKTLQNLHIYPVWLLPFLHLFFHLLDIGWSKKNNKSGILMTYRNGREVSRVLTSKKEWEEKRLSIAVFLSRLSFLKSSCTKRVARCIIHYILRVR